MGLLQHKFLIFILIKPVFNGIRIRSRKLYSIIKALNSLQFIPFRGLDLIYFAKPNPIKKLRFSLSLKHLLKLKTYFCLRKYVKSSRYRQLIL
jgi:hypothetical protein